MTISIFSKGKEYISASRASEKTGYSSDYIGQLSRAGKIRGTLIARTWYVDLSSLIEHKEMRKLGKPKINNSSKVLVEEPSEEVAEVSVREYTGVVSQKKPDNFFQYSRDERDLLPQLLSKTAVPGGSVPSSFMKEFAFVVAGAVLLVSGGVYAVERGIPGIAKIFNEEKSDHNLNQNISGLNASGEYQSVVAAGLSESSVIEGAARQGWKEIKKVIGRENEPKGFAEVGLNREEIRAILIGNSPSTLSGEEPILESDMVGNMTTEEDFAPGNYDPFGQLDQP